MRRRASDPRCIAAAVALLVRDAQPELLATAPAEASVLAARLAVAAMQKVGIEARPLAVGVQICNSALAPLVSRHLAERRTLPSAELMTEWIQASPAGARPPRWWTILGVGEQPPHVVAIVAGRWLVDLSIDLASAPLYGVELAPFSEQVSDEFLAGPGVVDLQTSGGELITYVRLLQQDVEHLPTWTSPAWRIRRQSNYLADGLRRTMRDAARGFGA